VKESQKLTQIKTIVVPCRSAARKPRNHLSARIHLSLSLGAGERQAAESETRSCEFPRISLLATLATILANPNPHYYFVSKEKIAMNRLKKNEVWLTPGEVTRTTAGLSGGRALQYLTGGPMGKTLSFQ